jgi:hypothetical protein
MGNTLWAGKDGTVRARRAWLEHFVVPMPSGLAFNVDGWVRKARRVGASWSKVSWASASWASFSWSSALWASPAGALALGGQAPLDTPDDD